jgi:AcrR family transcriptional regulator
MGGDVRTRSRKTGPEGSLDRGAYFNASFKILAEGGAEALTVDSLCARLGVTKGSFYHHFSGTADFVNGLMGCWAESTSHLVDELFAFMAADGDPYRSFQVIFAKLAAGQPHEAEAALRAWANSNPDVAAGVEQYDRIREEATIKFIGHFVDDPQRCRTLAYMAIGMSAGMQQRKPLDRERMMDVSLEFLRSNLGLDVQVVQDESGLRVHIKPARAKSRRTRPN